MITSSNNGSEAVGIINQALEDAGSSVTIGNESGSSVSDTLNEVFGDDVLDDTQSGSVWAQAVEDGFDGLSPVESSPLILLHTSDTHGGNNAGKAVSLDKAVELMQEDSDVDFLAITGDMTMYSSNVYTDDTKAQVATASAMNKLLMVPGNHDTYDNSHAGYGNEQADQVSETAWMKACMGQNVAWGDQNNNVGGYWHKDVVKDNKTVRIIGIDQYEVGSTVYTGYDKYYTVYSQAQIDWLLDLLYNTPSNYYIIIMLHEPAIQSTSSDDSVAQSMISEDNLFVSALLKHFGNRYDEPAMNLLPRIMRAYMHKENLSFTYTNKIGNHGTLTVAKDFSNRTPATFLFYIGGHLHCDLCGYLPNIQWADQLMLHITAGYYYTRYSTEDDLLTNFDTTYKVGQKYVTSEPDYRINKVTVDFTHRRIIVERIGQMTTAPYGSLPSRVRDEVVFPFKKGGTT